MRNFTLLLLLALFSTKLLAQDICRADTSYTDIIFLIDNSQSIDDGEFGEFENIIRLTINKVQDKCARSQVGLVHYGGARGAETFVEYDLRADNIISAVNRQYCTQRDPNSGNCIGGGGDDLNHAVGDILSFIGDGTLKRNPINKLVMVIFTDAFGFEESCGFVNCSVIRPFTNIDRFKRDFGGQVTVVGTSSQAEASLLAIYASPGGNFDNVQLFAQDCPSTFDGCQLPRKYIPIEFTSPSGPSSDSIVSCVSCSIEVIGGVEASAGENVNICSDRNESATLTATLTNGSEPITYTWDNGLGTGAIKMVNPANTTTYTVQITDGNGCSSSASVVVTVEDCTPPCTEAPLIMLPPTYIACPGTSILPEQTGFASIISGSGSQVCPQAEIVFSDRTVSNVSCSTHIERTWTARYPSLNDPALEASGLQNIYLIDTTAPVFINFPTDITIASDQTCSALVNWATISATDACNDVMITASRENGSRFDIGTTFVDFRATDACGNSTTKRLTIIVTDNCCTAPPDISCPDQFIGCPSDLIDPTNTGQAIATAGGNNCPTPSVRFQDVIVSESACQKNINRIWTAYYVIGSDTVSTECTQEIRLIDSEDPVFIAFPEDISINSNSECMALVRWTAVTASDNCGDVTISSTRENGSFFDLGETVVVITATDPCGNSISRQLRITVLDNCCQQAPLLTCAIDYIGCPEDSVDPIVTGFAIGSPGADDCPKPDLTFEDEILMDTLCLKVINRTWTASYTTHSGLDEVSCVQRIVLQDTENPVFVRFPENIVISSDANCMAIVNWLSPLAEDNCGEVIVTSSLENGASIDIGQHEVVFTAVDPCGNVSTRILFITVTKNCCQAPPILTCPADFSDCPSTTANPTRTGEATAVAGEPDCPTPVVTFMDEVMNADPCQRVIVRTWRAAYPGLNDSALVTTCRQVISLLDTIPPAIIGCPTNMTLNPNSPIVHYNDPQLSDACSYSLSYNIPSGTRLEEGMHTVVITATDACGNFSVCSFIVTVPPRVKLFCPADVELDCVDSLDLSTLPIPQVETLCDKCGDPIEGFTFMTQAKGISYYISKDVLNWPNAKSKAESMGAQLVVISDPEENALLTSVLDENSVFIGLSDREKEGTFVWVDGSPMTYSNWFFEQPNNYGNSQDYVELMNNGFWNDQSNNKSLKYIIEIPCVAISKVIVAQRKEGNSDIYTVRYTAEDRCATMDSCDIEVIVNNEAFVTCSEDKVAYSLYGWSRVEWQEPTFTTCCTNCEPRHIPGYLYMGQLGNSFYYCSYARLTWLNARIKARDIGGDLVTIDSELENSFLAAGLIDRRAYIGLSDVDREGVFTWADGANAAYRNWETGGPNNTGENDFVEMGLNGRWILSDKNAMREYIVEIKGCHQVTQTAGPKSGSLFQEGITTITYRASDGCGNVATCSFDVTVIKGKAETKESELKNNRQTLLSDKIVLYPNPANGLIFVEDNEWFFQAIDISIMSTTGQLIRKVAAQELIHGHNISDLSSGLHFIRFADENGQVRIERFIVN